jgi:hypothetical protein
MPEMNAAQKALAYFYALTLFHALRETMRWPLTRVAVDHDENGIVVRLWFTRLAWLLLVPVLFKTSQVRRYAAKVARLQQAPFVAKVVRA